MILPDDRTSLAMTDNLSLEAIGKTDVMPIYRSCNPELILLCC